MGSMVGKQAAFFANLCQLRQFAAEQGFTITLGEAERTQYQQDEYYRTGASKKQHSIHQDRLAADLHFYVQQNGSNICVDVQMPAAEAKRILTPIGQYWEGLDPQNVWGGFYPEHYGTTFLDVPHFERKP